MWKLLNNVIPTDWHISKKGIFLPSKCVCCSSYFSIEHNNHLFLTSEVAVKIWGFFATLFEINTEALTMRHMLSSWWRKAKGTSLYSWLRQLLPCSILWHI